MGRDRSLDEFLGGGSEESAASGDDPGADEGDATDPEADTDGTDTEPEPGSAGASESDADGGGSESPARESGSSGADAAADGDAAATAPDDVEPAAVTYRWEPGGVRCPDCGATVETLWSGESGRVCAECKEW